MGGIFSKRTRNYRNEKPPAVPPKLQRGSLPRDKDDLSEIPLQQLALLTTRRPLRIKFRTPEEILGQHQHQNRRREQELEASWRRRSHPVPSYLNVDHRTQSRTVSFQNRGYGYVEKLVDEDSGPRGILRRPRVVEGRQSYPSSFTESASPSNTDIITVIVEPPTPEPSDMEGNKALVPARTFRRSLKEGLKLDRGTYRFKVNKPIEIHQSRD